MRIFRRILKWTGIGVGALVVLVLLLVSVVLNTSFGARAALRQVLPRLPVEARVAGFDGRLTREFMLTGIVYSSDAADVSVDTLSVSWHPWGLLGGKVNIDRLLVAGVAASVYETAPAAEKVAAADTVAAPVSLELPVDVEIGEARVRRAQVDAPGGMRADGIDVVLSGSPEAYRLDARAHVVGDQIPETRVALGASGSMEYADVDSLRADLLGGTVVVVGRAAWLPAVEWDVSLAVDSIAPAELAGDTTLAGTVSLRAGTRGKLEEGSPHATVALDSLHGNLRGYEITGHGNLDVEDTRAELDALTLAWGSMRVVIDGWTEWSPGVSWNVAVRADSVAPSLFMTDPTVVPGAFTLHARTSGSFDSVLVAHANIDSLQGRLRDHDLRGGGALDVHGERVEADSFLVEWGTARVQLAGVYGEQIDLVARLSIPEASRLYPDASGSLLLDAVVRGPRREPAVRATIRADSIQFQEYEVSELHVDADVDVLGSGDVDADVRVYDIFAAGERVDSVVVLAAGNLDAHEVSLGVGSTRGVADFHVAGSVADSVWSGTLDRFHIAVGAFGDWNLSASAPLQLSPAHAGLEPVRMESAGTAVTLSGRWARGDTIRAAVAIDSLAYALADTLLPEAMRIEGWLDLTLDAAVAPSGDLAGALAIESSPGTLTWTENGNTRLLGFDSTYVHGGVDTAGVHAELSSRVLRGDEVLTRVTGEFRLMQLTNVNRIPEDPEFSAKVRVLFADLSFVDAFSRSIRNARGRFDMNAGLGGKVSNPQFVGTVDLTNAGFDVVPLGLTIHDVNIQAEGAKGRGLSLQGKARSGGGTIELSTEIRRDTSRVHLTGSEFSVSNTSEAQVRISPDLELNVEGGRVDLQGEVRVPYAKIELYEVAESAVGPSKDVVYVGADTAEAKTPIDIFADMRVVLAEDSVTFRGFGFYGEINGGLLVRERPGRPTTASGELKIENGTYDAYGQLLKIDPGRIRYAGGPIDNPGFDIRAYRDVTQYSVRAGLLIRGTARRPQITVFSDPAMSQNEALSYLLTGQPLASDSQRDMAAAAALSLGMAQSNAYMQSLGRDVGLDEARFEAGGTMEEASFVAGKYLSPKLYISNTMGLFDRVSTWRVRYFMSKRWTLQAESGKATGTDLFYKFER